VFKGDSAIPPMAISTYLRKNYHSNIQSFQYEIDHGSNLSNWENILSKWLDSYEKPTNTPTDNTSCLLVSGYEPILGTSKIESSLAHARVIELAKKHRNVKLLYFYDGRSRPVVDAGKTNLPDNVDVVEVFSVTVRIRLISFFLRPLFPILGSCYHLLASRSIFKLLQDPDITYFYAESEKAMAAIPNDAVPLFEYTQYNGLIEEQKTHFGRITNLIVSFFRNLEAKQINRWEAEMARSVYICNPPKQ